LKANGSTHVPLDVSHTSPLLQKVLNILLLLFVIMLFYGWFGVVMFVDTPEGKQLFPNLIEGVWTLWICVTTANYPDVMMPGYNENRWVALYFVTFMIISFFFLMNVILASVVNEYDTAVVEHRREHADRSTANLKKAYRLLTLQEQGAKLSDDCTRSIKSSATEGIDRKTVMDLFSMLNDDFPEFRRLTEDDTNLLFAILDRDGSSTISEEEFMEFGNVLMLEFFKASDYATFVEVHYPMFFRSDGWQRFCRIVKATYFEYAIDLILILNAIVVAIQSWPELSDQEVVLDSKYYDGSIDTVWGKWCDRQHVLFTVAICYLTQNIARGFLSTWPEYMETAFTIIYTVEVLSKVAVFGWKAYTERMRNLFDFSITLLAIFSTAIVYYPSDYSDSRLIRMILTARVLRLIRLLTALKPFQLIGEISAEIVPAATSVIWVLFFVMYFFAALGMQLYGGLITRDPQNPIAYRLLGTEFSDSEYWANNFNDMISGMNVRQWSGLVTDCHVSAHTLVCFDWTGSIQPLGS
jgi:two pore calcium channel protein, plant